MKTMVDERPARPVVREPVVDGIFYPAEPEPLRQIMDELFAPYAYPGGNAFAIISPHAGYRYSGSLAAKAYRSVSARDIDTVVIIAPVHRDPEDGVFLAESEYFLTPLGQIPVNQDSTRELAGCSTKLIVNDIPHLDEHCIEVQLPFVQHTFPNASIVPILLGRTSLSNVKALSHALQVVFGDSYDRVLFVVSANLTAYLNGQVAGKNAETLLRLIRAGDWEGILRAEGSGAVNSCGAGCIAGLLAFDIALQPSVLSTGDSSQVNGDKENVVHYAAISLDAEELGLHGVQPD